MTRLNPRTGDPLQVAEFWMDENGTHWRQPTTPRPAWPDHSRRDLLLLVVAVVVIVVVAVRR